MKDVQQGLSDRGFGGGWDRARGDECDHAGGRGGGKEARCADRVEGRASRRGGD